MKNKEESYNGFRIGFDERKEVWYANINENGEDAQYDTSDERIENISLKKLKELLDLVKRKKFQRIPIFIRTNNYRYGAGDDKKYEAQYTEAMITSIAPNGNAYTVAKGKKSSTKTNLKYSEDSIILDTPENRKIISEIEKNGEIEWRAEVAQKKLKTKLAHIDGKKAYKEVYGKELS